MGDDAFLSVDRLACIKQTGEPGKIRVIEVEDEQSVWDQVMLDPFETLHLLIRGVQGLKGVAGHNNIAEFFPSSKSRMSP